MTTLSIDTLRLRAESALSRPPPIERIERPIPEGYRVASFIIPISLLPTSNQTGRIAGSMPWARTKLKNNLFQVMWAQCRRFDQPLKGRPQVHCVRFSSSEPDAYSDWAKLAIDILCARTEKRPKRLNIIVDDRPACVEVRQWWEPAPRGEGFAMISVYEGAR